MIIRALGRTVVSDPRPAIGFLLASAVASTVGGAVISASLDLIAAEHGSTGAAPGIESILQMTAVATVMALFVNGRGLALSLQPEFRRLRGVGAPSGTFWRFGLLAVALALVVSIGSVISLSGSISERWAEALAPLVGTGTTSADTRTLLITTAALSLACVVGWLSGTRQEARFRHARSRLSIALASTVAVVFIVPTVVAVTFAPELSGAVRESSGAEQADRLAALGSADGSLAVLSGAIFGLFGATVILTPLLTRVVLAAAARCSRSGPVTLFVGLRLAQSRSSQFGALTGVVVAASGLVNAHALTSAVAAATATTRSGADVTEIATTLGPTLVIAGACAVGMALAQSRGTGTELRTLRRLGVTWAASCAAVFVGAMALGVVSIILSATAAATAGIVATSAGLEPTAFTRINFTAPAVVSASAVGLVVVAFLGSELVGALRTGAR